MQVDDRKAERELGQCVDLVVEGHYYNNEVAWQFVTGREKRGEGVS